MFKKQFKIPIILSIIVMILAIIASAGGIFIGDLYQDNVQTKAAWYGNDLVTLFVVVPLMIWALSSAARESYRAQLVWLGGLWYMVYNYIFYLYGAAFNNFFLLYVALFVLSTYGLIFALIKLDTKRIAETFSTRTPVRRVSCYMVFFSLLLGGLWIAKSIGFIMTGQVPQDILQTGHTTAMVYATDLALLMPATVLSGILLWKREAWGYVLSTIVMMKCVMYSLVLLVMSAVAYLKIGKGDPYIILWSVLGTGAFLCLVSLLRSMKGKGAVFNG
ncbi:MAG: hypothetical protein K0R93_2543 [Anaerosolibacter sp.]|jgi:hypothetical protein|uniref:hypothetical protein n=1 Tax=Anaerosolibacter sp. TaxID=1872527 RepID=UPI002615205E|nr:hypothetical protein [Anaerosolibacter sp.]MDF2547645.1 hypothetical protein [Anaerosolibacter sp.]